MTCLFFPSRTSPDHVCVPKPCIQGPNWSMEEVYNLMALRGDAEVQGQFAGGGHSNTHVYEALSGRIDERGHSWMVNKCLVKIKALWGQWVAVTDQNHQSGCAHKTMSFIWRLSQILVSQAPRHNPAVYTSRGGLTEPLPQTNPSSVDISPHPPPWLLHTLGTWGALAVGCLVCFASPAPTMRSSLPGHRRPPPVAALP